MQVTGVSADGWKGASLWDLLLAPFTAHSAAWSAVNEVTVFRDLILRVKDAVKARREAEKHLREARKREREATRNARERARRLER